jgi:hypothetical protein
VFCLPAAIAAAWTVYAGKDLNWDLLNYHFYLPYELLGGRLQQDFFAASAQSYLNPIGYVPFYLMVASGWHSIAVSIVLAIVHALSISLLFLLAWKLFAHRSARERAVFSCLATALGAATAVFWPTVGTSFLDPLLVPLMLAGLLLLLGRSRSAVGRATLAGALFGMAAALKYSNGIYVLAAFPLALALPEGSYALRLRAGLGYVAGGALALAVFAGPWFALMMGEFGNPVFPLMNGWFQSPHAAAVNLVGERFTPRDVAATLTFPLRMVTLDRNLYSEIFAPDLRFAFLLLAVLALPVRGQNSLREADWRVLGFLACGALLWIVTSANARYGLIVLLLAGLALARLVERLLPPRVARIALGLLLAVQVGVSVLASPSRWFLAEPWSARWLPYEVPERALREPALYLSAEVLPMAVVTPFLHRASSFVNVRGQHTLPTGSPRLAALLERHRDRVRALGRRLALVDGKPAPAEVQSYDAALRRFGYRLDVADCFTIAWRPDDDDFLSRAANALSAAAPAAEPLSVVSCALVPAPRDPRDVEAELKFSALFDRIEKACPQLFRGQTAVTEPFGTSGWSRTYNGLDARLEAFGGRVILHRHRSGELVDLAACQP